MREIKFRLRIDNKIIGYEKWYRGCQGEYTGAEPKWLYSKDGKYWNQEYIYHKQKDQFTGLLDKNGKDVFEGDIVKFRKHKATDSQIRIGKVVWVESFAQFMIEWFEDDFEKEKDYPSRVDFNLRSIEVIGNIYKNPELLNK